MNRTELIEKIGKIAEEAEAMPNDEGAAAACILYCLMGSMSVGHDAILSKGVCQTVEKILLPEVLKHKSN